IRGLRVLGLQLRHREPLSRRIRERLPVSEWSINKGEPLIFAEDLSRTVIIHATRVSPVDEGESEQLRVRCPHFGHECRDLLNGPDVEGPGYEWHEKNIRHSESRPLAGRVPASRVDNDVLIFFS